MKPLIDRLLDRQVCSPAQNSCRNNHLLDEAFQEITRLQDALAASKARDNELRDAAAAVRLADKECPIRSARSYTSNCSLCNADASQSCGRSDVAEQLLLRKVLGLFPNAQSEAAELFELKNCPILMTMTNPCAHNSFRCTANIGRLSRDEGGPVTGYTADISIACAECGIPFRFSGLSAGNHFHEPRVSIDGTELRAPIEPADHQIFAARAAYSIPPKAAN